MGMSVLAPKHTKYFVLRIRGYSGQSLSFLSILSMVIYNYHNYDEFCVNIAPKNRGH